MVFQKIGWLVGGTLSACMIFSSVAAVHGIALASVRERGMVDLDIIPVYCIVGVGMPVVWTLSLSRTIRKASASVHVVLYAWFAILYAGMIASSVSLAALPSPLSCSEGLLSVRCPLDCDSTLPMRAGQTAVAIPFRGVSLLECYIFLQIVIYSTFAFFFLGTTFVWATRPRNTHRADFSHFSHSNIGAQGHKPSTGSWGDIITSCVWILSQIAVTEFEMMRPPMLPIGEPLSTFGQWGPLTGALLAICGSLGTGFWENFRTNEGFRHDLESLRYQGLRKGVRSRLKRSVTV